MSYASSRVADYIIMLEFMRIIIFSEVLEEHENLAVKVKCFQIFSAIHNLIKKDKHAIHPLYVEHTLYFVST